MQQQQLAAAHGIHTLDTGYVRPAFDAAYLVVERGRAAFVDCGTNHSVPVLMQALADAGLGAEAVDWVVLTHAHLDHAGGAGLLMRQLPNARLVAHPRAAPHMVDPQRLVAGAMAVYGEEQFARHYGSLEPVPESRVVVAADGHAIDLAGRILRCLDTPGHARHHMCIWDERSRGWFTGDTFGLSYRQLDSDGRAFVLPTSSPVQFEPEAMQASIRRMLESAPERMYLTHYGPVGEVRRLAADLHEQIDAMVSLAQACDGGPDRHRALVAALSEYYLERAQAHGVPLDEAGVLDLLGMDIELNAQGLEVWLDRSRRRG
ncbi:MULTISPECIES: MBL fold metallo-hydrolase [Pseudoxanthomonas]|uniref:Glyoxylase-like metal-dependent hydrolase (Beta-lactamase superfamily II) n=1 Tax=Pseudoxanthomonas taiwanensis J19 TaxID=935569 RepID=A0A562DKJ9_9GAMM|nr:MULTISPECIES: MBL fold metallo-hydrolase [Pseudoxanthomonas]TWH10151.1 glyoxylase-like metal-dependent hydrolase (beta-lactamase superfamily II) [Pseudoxanthomonas taiwanensis J19]